MVCLKSEGLFKPYSLGLLWVLEFGSGVGIWNLA